MSDGPVYATRKFTFSAAHRYGRPEWSESENRRVFGHLTVSHGHNYVLEVTIRGPVDAHTGMVMDLAELKRVVSDAIIQRFDHADPPATSRKDCATQAPETIINPYFAAPQHPTHRFFFGRAALGELDKLRIMRSPREPVDIGLRCPGIRNGIVGREGHNHMIAVQAAPHGG